MEPLTPAERALLVRQAQALFAHFHGAISVRDAAERLYRAHSHTAGPATDFIQWYQVVQQAFRMQAAATVAEGQDGLIDVRRLPTNPGIAPEGPAAQARVLVTVIHPDGSRVSSVVVVNLDGEFTAEQVRAAALTAFRLQQAQGISPPGTTQAFAGDAFDTEIISLGRRPG